MCEGILMRCKQYSVLFQDDPARLLSRLLVEIKYITLYGGSVRLYKYTWA